MKLGIISDIHSNILAFRACMEYLEKRGCEEYVFLGDYISDTPYTRQTMDYLYGITEKYPCHLIRGNREEYMLRQKAVCEGRINAPRWERNSASGNLLYTYERLEQRDFDFFSQLSCCMCYEKEGYPAITFCHGSPAHTRELLQFDGENTKEWMKRIETSYLFAAHTHYPGVRQFGSKIYMNSGSCGIAISDYGYAQCVLLESVEIKGKIQWKADFLKIPYDAKQVVHDIFDMGLYEYAPWFLNANIHILLTGIDKCAEFVPCAQRLQARACGKEPVWPYIEERFFAQAAEELGIVNYMNWREDE